MDEDGAYDALRAFLLKLAADALLIDPTRPVFGEVIRDAQGAPRPSGPYAMIEFLADRDLEEFNDERYSAITVGSGPAPKSGC